MRSETEFFSVTSQLNDIREDLRLCSKIIFHNKFAFGIVLTVE